MFDVTSSPISSLELSQNLASNQSGALVTFEGRVRDHNEGKEVSSLEYQIYEKLALKEGKRIIEEAKEKFNIHNALAVHRFGHLNLREIAIWIGATAAHRDDAYKASRFIIDEIKSRLPIWKKEHYLNHEPKWVFCRDHHNHIHFSEADYYQKQKTVINQDRLKNSKVLVIGAGGLGCPALLSLASSGVGEIGVMDFDKVSIGNIHRQYLYAPNDVGEFKVNIAKKRLQELNPFININARNAYFNADNAKIIEEYDLVLDCADNLETKYLVHDACLKFKRPLISASLFKFEGQLRTYSPSKANGCLRCLNSEAPADSLIGNCNDFGVLSPVVGTIGSMQASEALLYLETGANNSIEHTHYFDLKRLSQRKFKNLKRHGCEYCAGQIELEGSSLEISINQLEKLNAKLIDIRDLSDEEAMASASSKTTTVLYCHRGVRSKKIARALRENGRDVYSLVGGACSL